MSQAEVARHSDVVVAVLTYRGYQTTRACVRSLVSAMEWPFPVVIVDNASGTNEGRRIAEEFGAPVTFLETPSNHGVPTGYNAALQWGQERGFGYVLLLNNDTLYRPGTINRLRAAAKGDVAVVGPLVEQPDGKLQSAGGRISWRTGRAVSIGRDDVARWNAPYEVDWVDGSCMLVSTAAVHAIGGLAPEFFMYWEEVDWCVRACRAGWRCLVEPRASIVHLGSVTVEPAARLKFWMRNRILFMRRHASRVENVLSLSVFVGVTVPRHLARSMRRRRSPLPVVRAAVAAVGWNMRDAAARRAWLVPPGLSAAIGDED